MIIRKVKIWFIIVLVIVIFALKIYAEDPDDIQYKFTQTNSSFIFYGSFRINANPECLLDISFNYEHIRALAPDAEEVQLIDQGSNWNQISYTYKKFTFFKNKSVWHRTLDKENQRVDFTLVSSENNHSIMPRMISSKGFYQIKQKGEYSIVEYYQKCQLREGVITKFYLNSAKKGAIKFLHRFFKYADTFCNKSKSTTN